MALILNGIVEIAATAHVLAERFSKWTFLSRGKVTIENSHRCWSQIKSGIHKKKLVFLSEMKTADPLTNASGQPCTVAGEPFSNPEQEICSDQWVDRFGDSLYRYAYIRTGDQHIAEELVQETFVAAISGRKQFRNESTVKTWLFAILKRKTADHFRVQTRVTEAQSLDLDVQQHSVATRRASHQWTADPAKICEDREFWERFQQCVDKLPRVMSEVFILCEVNQLSPKESRELLGISATNLSMRLYRCRMALRECLDRTWFGNDH